MISDAKNIFLGIIFFFLGVRTFFLQEEIELQLEIVCAGVLRYLLWRFAWINERYGTQKRQHCNQNGLKYNAALLPQVVI